MRITSLLLLCLVPCAGLRAAEADRPNILFILTDDLGYGDVGAFGQKRFATPSLDRLAAEGARLTHHYCAAPVCAPSRASLLLGVHQGHANVRDNQFDKALENNHTLATVLRRAGYATAAIGKWGLHGQPVGGSPSGGDPTAPAHPLNRGFDSFYGVLRHIDGHEHYPKEAPYFTAKAKARGPVKVWDNRTDVTAGLDRCYTTDLFTARAKRFISEHHAKAPRQPFFVFLAFDTPHAVLELPTQAYPAGGGLKGGLQWLGEPGRMITTATGSIDSWTHPDTIQAAPSESWPDVYRRYATSVRRIDDGVADLVKLLRDLGLDENALVVFTSDNGPEAESMLAEPFTPEFFRSYGPFDGLKRDLWEGGTRVPTIARWPRRIPATTVVAEPCAHWDWMPTLAEVAGLPPPARTDGTSLLPLLTGRGEKAPRRPLYFEYFVAGRTPPYPDFESSRRGRPRQQMQAVRAGDLVGVRYNVTSADDPFEIYDVVRDPKEAHRLEPGPATNAAEARMKEFALRARRPDPDAPRPYDRALVPAVAETPSAFVPGVEWRTYDGRFPWLPDCAALRPSLSGRSARPSPSSPETDAAVTEFTGFLSVPADGEYTFHLANPGPAMFRLHDATIIDADFGYAPGTERRATARLARGLHPFRLTLLRPDRGAGDLALQWSGPGLERQPISDRAWFSSGAAVKP